VACLAALWLTAGCRTAPPGRFASPKADILLQAHTQAVGRAIKEAGFSGLWARSQASPDAKNLVIFPANLTGADALSAPTLKPLALK
jgi:hypothetical protein